MTEDQIKHTKEWWTRLCSDEALMHAWLSKLRSTEYGGFVDHVNFLQQHQEVDARLAKIIENIGDDERRHAAFLDQVIRDRGWKLMLVPESTYWESILSSVVTAKDYCAANYYGEAAACDRFTIMRDMDCTPSDVKAFIDFALPDEVFHRVTLKREAGEETLEKFKVMHDEAMAKILRRR